ncbi:hypothetical protein HPB52_011882 [Rhipicephalus sanguineus]|uniref:Uncharacterized protein n=1 Tax=Rhipicephalus sanguineus TaxID=34632 RepID=A0A9D4QB21_RHISA|nr:hypothetical protein HPB52_011882 [Rhipicephalus sanguineus]
MHGKSIWADLQEDGPPPDPNYRFLADRMREGDADGGGDRGGSRRHRDNYGGQDFDNVRHAMRQDKALQRESGHVLPPKLAMTGRQRREYEQWKSDRAAIDQERMQRHTDAEGNFTREWDLHKELGPDVETERYGSPTVWADKQSGDEDGVVEVHKLGPSARRLTSAPGGCSHRWCCLPPEHHNHAIPGPQQ